MLPTVLVLLVVALCFGLLLLLAGLRGRRLNDHPVCSWCKFDLEGVYPECVTCPECGAGLKRDRAVLNGVRKRMPTLVVVGALLIVTAALPFGVVAYTAITGGDINKQKPLGFLLWEAGFADQAHGQKIADEIMSRVLASKLDPAQYQRVIGAALDFQADRSHPWAEGWGDLIERARFDGVLKPEDEKRFAAQAPVFEIRTRASVNAGGKLPILIKLKEARVGSSSSMLCPVRVNALRVGGRELQLAPSRAREVQTPFGLVRNSGDSGATKVFALNGSGAPNLRGFAGVPTSGELGLVYDIPADAPSGSQAVDVTVGAAPGTQPNTGFPLVLLNGRLQTPKVAAEDVAWSETPLKTRVQVVAPDQPAVTPTSVTPDELASLVQKLRPSELQRSDGMGLLPLGAKIDGGGAFQLDFNCADLPKDVAYDVYVKGPDGEAKLGSFTSGKPVDVVDDPFAGMVRSTMTISINGQTRTSTTGGQSSKHTRTVLGKLPFQPGATVDIVLRPAPGEAGATIDQSSYVDQPLEFKAVPVQVDPLEEMDRRMNEMLKAQGLRGRFPLPR